MQEESGESVSSDSSRVAEWLCPLCQQGQPDRSSLSLHLTGQHNVLSNCVDKLLDIAVPKQCASGEVKDTDTHNTTEAALQQMKHGEDSQPCQTEENSHAVQQPKDKVMEEEVCGQGAAEQGAGGAQPESQGNQPTGEATQRNTTENAEMAEANATTADKNGVVVPPKVTRSFKCTACHEAFLSKTALSVHYSSDTHIQQMNTGGETDKSVVIPVLARPYLSNKPYQCAVCRVSYNHAITLESHMKSVLHQTRSRNAGNAANSTAATGGSGSSSNSVPSPEVGASQLVTTTNRSAPGSLMATAKDGEQIPVSAAAPSLLASPVATAQAVSAFLTLLTSSPGSVSHSLLPSLFAAGTAPGVATPQLVPQPQMLMPLILNGLQTQQSQENQPGHLLTQCVPLLGLSPAQQALVAQRLNSLQNQGPAVGVQAITQSCVEEQKGEDGRSEEEHVKQEDKTVKEEKKMVKEENKMVKEENKIVKEENKIVKEEVKVEDRDSLPVAGVKRERGEEEETKELISKMIKLEKDGEEGKMEGADGDSTTDGGDSLTDQSGLDGGDKVAVLPTSPTATEKSFRNNNLSPSTSVRSNSSLSPVHLNLTLSPDSTPQKSQAGTSPCGSVDSLKTSPYKSTSFSPDHTRPCHNTKGRYTSPGPPVLSEFQSEVLSAFFESRSEADAASPPREDCEALGREVGLTEDEVRRWLCQARNVKVRQRAMGSEHSQDRAGLATQIQVDGLDNDFDEDESSLIIAESEDGAEASSSQAIDLSSSRRKRKERAAERNNQGDRSVVSCLTSDSETEEHLYTSVIVSDDESQNGSLREGPDSPVKDEAQREPAGNNKGPSGGKVLRSTTVFLSDAEDEYEEEDAGGGQRANLKKRKREFEREEVEVKKERQDPDVDLELEAQGDPPSTQVHSMDHTGLPSGMLHSLPLALSLAPFSAQFLSPYVLSLPPSILGDKLATFSNPPNITRFAEPLITQSLSSHGQISHYLSNGGDCESALDLSIGKRSNSKSTSSSSSSSMVDRTLLQKGRLLDGLGLRPTSKGLVVVQVKPDGSTTTASNSNTSMVNCNSLNKSSIYMRAAEKMNATLMEREREREKEKEQQQRRSKGRRYRDMRRSRTIIQAEQLDILYGCYFKDPNPGKHEFEQISEWVHLPKKVVQIWFQNMRARERKGEVRFISDGTLAALGKPLIKFTWPLSKPIFSNKPPTTTNSSPGSISTTTMVRTLIKTEKEPVEMGKLLDVVKNLTPVPIKPREAVSSSMISPVSCVASSVPKIKLETTSNLTMVKIAPKMNTPILLAPPKELFPIAPRPVLKLKLEEESEDDKTDEEKDGERETRPVPGATNRMVPKIPTTPINNKPPATATVQQKQNGINYWTPKGSFKINTLSREQLALPMHNAPSRTIPPPPTPSIAPVSPNIPSKVASPATPAVVKSSPTENSFLPHSCSRRPRTHLSCLQLSILQSCYETCAHPNAMECEAIGTELSLPLKVVQIWFQNTRAKEKRWRLQQEKMSPVSGGKVDMSSGSYLQYNALRANRPILPKPVQLTVIETVTHTVAGQSTPKETLTGRCEVCNITFESRAAARSHVFSPRHLATLRTTNFGQPATLVSKNGTSSGGPGGTIPGSQITLSSPVSSSGGGSGGETIVDVESPPSPATTSSS